VTGCDGAGDLAFAVDLTNGGAVNDGIGAVVEGVGGQFAVRCDDVQPLGKEQVDSG